jgi:DNA-binding transcriptional LysR family regulator
MTEDTIADRDLYRLFFAVAGSKSISKAAARVGVSQPTLGRRMAELENHLDVPLLYRTSSGVTMTSEGKRLYRNASALVGSFEDFERDFRSEAGDRGALLRISASEGVTRPRRQSCPSLTSRNGDLRLPLRRATSRGIRREHQDRMDVSHGHQPIKTTQHRRVTCEVSGIDLPTA